MHSYRLFYLKNNHLVRAEELDAADDTEAMRQAEARLDGNVLELWADHRKIKVFADVETSPQAPLVQQESR